MLRIVLATILIVPFASGSLQAQIPFNKYGYRIDRIVVFGDSLSDAGNVLERNLAQPGSFVDPPPFLPPLFGNTPLYFEGRATNGPNWVDYLADSLFLERPIASELGGMNYAFSGAKSGQGTNTRSPSVTFPGNQPLEVDRVGLQIDNFLAAHGAFQRKQLIIVWVGANDLRDVTGIEDIFVAIDNVESHLREIVANGGRKILVPNQLDATLAPFFQIPGGPSSDEVGFVTRLYNFLLTLKMIQLSFDPGLWPARIIPVDMFSLTSELETDPRFTNTTEPALNLIAGTLASNPDDYVFWDFIHPTTRAHSIIAETALARVVRAL